MAPPWEALLPLVKVRLLRRRGFPAVVEKMRLVLLPLSVS